MTERPANTAQRVTVLQQGKVYLSSCNVCRWEGRRHWSNVQQAETQNRHHRAVCIGEQK